ncbi:hypothetical protein L6164_022803 [Bauhinia variegata]|uniref:Uncharacterized protein n=1 Tax=Bauhinia variegata TaxID=167791 RepID=A0ACB9MJC2_BAUVA|nr:hypothetical protein L6164_022803 [Bauhinia variegata]
MSNKHEAVTAYPPAPAPRYVIALPPPMGYPTKDGPAGYGYPQQQSVPQAQAQQTTTRGDGFWKGCCAALCCCCVLDCCF